MSSEAMKAAQVLLDIVGNIDNADAFVAGMTAEQFLNDTKPIMRHCAPWKSSRRPAANCLMI
jgi:hypothetical protein